jgi:hypothetical protein
LHLDLRHAARRGRQSVQVELPRLALSAAIGRSPWITCTVTLVRISAAVVKISGGSSASRKSANRFSRTPFSEPVDSRATQIMARASAAFRPTAKPIVELCRRVPTPFDADQRRDLPFGV